MVVVTFIVFERVLRDFPYADFESVYFLITKACFVCWERFYRAFMFDVRFYFWVQG